MFKLRTIWSHQLSIQRDNSRVNPPSSTYTPRENHERYVPALARAHLAAESVISANKVSLGLRGMAGGGGGRWGRTKGDATLFQLPTLCSQHTRTRARALDTCANARVCLQARTRTQSCGRGLLRTRGDNKICDNQPQRRRRRRRRRRESVMTLSWTSFQATSVTLRAHLFPISISFPLFSFPPLCLFPSSRVYL